jgi:SAM-dependent methyltransferase
VKRWAWHTTKSSQAVSSHDHLQNASPWVERFASQIPKQGLVLDLACGGGRHAVFLAQLGYSVLGVDQDVSQLESLGHPGIQTKAMDLELKEWPLEGAQFTGIVVTNYLYRPHLDRLPQMLASQGVLIYETFAQGNERFGKPSNPNFLLNEGELLALAARHRLKILAYEDIYTNQPKPAMVQRLCAVKEV